MIKSRFFVVILAGILLQIISLSAMIYDNRFMPLYGRTYSRTCECPSAVMPDGFIMTGRDAFGKDGDIGLFEQFGLYDQSQVAQAIALSGRPNPFDLPTTPISIRNLKDDKIIWNMGGKLQTQGFSIQYEQHIWGCLSTGFSAFFMHLNSRNNFVLSPDTVTSLRLNDQQIVALDQLRREMNGMLGLKPAFWSVFGVSDVDWYLRFGGIWDYTFKCRRIDAGLRIGTIFPSGLKRNIDNPASIPFGGNGLWGLYAALDAELEIRQDWYFGLLFRCNRRFSQVQEARFPLAQEQPLYAAGKGRVDIDPGFTVIFSPYVRFEAIREGLGVQGQYTLVAHNSDDWHVVQRAQNEQPHLASLLKHTEWKAEYITVDVFYDFRSLGWSSPLPIFSVKWDIPNSFFLGNDAAKTHRLSMGIIFTF